MRNSHGSNEWHLRWLFAGGDKKRALSMHVERLGHATCAGRYHPQGKKCLALPHVRRGVACNWAQSYSIQEQNARDVVEHAKRKREQMGVEGSGAASSRIRPIGRFCVPSFHLGPLWK